MRVSNAMMAENIQNYLYKQTKALLKTQESIASGKRINRLSDDPIGMGQALGYRRTISKLEQFNENITSARQHLDTVENILAAVTELLEDTKDIAADQDPSMRSMMADQVVTIRDQIFQLANSRNNGNYLFSGDLTDTQPFERDTATGVYSYEGDGGTKDHIIGEGLQVSITADGSQIFQGAGDVFDVLNDLEAALRADDGDGVTDQLPLLSEIVEGLNGVRAVNAGQSKRLEATQNYNKAFNVNVSDLLSQVEDTDIVEAAINLQLQETAYEITLATAAKIIQPNLMNFLS
jgi:flagellar hook-associated protein 3 FlgL